MSVAGPGGNLPPPKLSTCCQLFRQHLVNIFGHHQEKWTPRAWGRKVVNILSTFRARSTPAADRSRYFEGRSRYNSRPIPPLDTPGNTPVPRTGGDEPRTPEATGRTGNDRQVPYKANVRSLPTSSSRRLDACSVSSFGKAPSATSSSHLWHSWTAI